MAFITDEQKANTQSANAAPGVPGTPGAGTQPPMTSAGPGAGPTGAKGAPTGAATNTAAAQPFTNLNAYLTANAPQVQNQANTIAGNLTSQYGQTQNDINAGTSAFNQQVAGGYAAPNAQVVQQAAADPTNFAQTPSNVAAFQGQLNDQYTGPANFEGTSGYAGLNKEVNSNVANANQLNTIPGIQTFLQGTEKNPTQGENTLDAVLLNQSPNAIKQVQAAAAPFSQLPDYLSGNVTAADQGVTNAQAQAKQAAQFANSTFLGPGGVAPTFQNALTNAVPAAQAQQNAYNSTVAQNASALNPMNTALNSFEERSGVTGLDNPLSAYLNQKALTGAPSLATVATSPQYAEDAALAKLLGTQYNPQLDQANVGQAGSFSVPTATAANPQSLAQQLADISTQGTFSQKVLPNINATNARMAGLVHPLDPFSKNNLDPTFDSDIAAIQRNTGDTTPNSESSFIANQPPPISQGFWSPFDPGGSGYNDLMSYLAGINPSGFTKGNGGAEIVNS